MHFTTSIWGQKSWTFWTPVYGVGIMEPFTTEDHVSSCNAWISTNGPITSSNFIDCFLDVLQSFERTVSNVKAILGHIMDSGNIQACGHCGRVPALMKTVNGQKHLLCGECRDSLLFAELGPGQGYV